MGPGWGDRVSLPADAAQVGNSLLGASLDPRFWIPAVAALVFGMKDFDERASDWAIDHRPLFGSEGSANTASDALLGVLAAETVVTMALTPSGTESSGWISGRAKGVLVEIAALGATIGTTELLKETVERKRPRNEVLTSSFPSGHSSEAFALVTLSSKNYQAMGLDPSTRGWIEAGNTVVAGLTGWARVESGKHFPSDVLAGAALGHLVTTFVHDVFMGENPDDAPTVMFGLGRGEASVAISWRF